MKKQIAWILVLLLLFLAACDTGNGAGENTSEGSSAVTDPVETSGNAESEGTSGGAEASQESVPPVMVLKVPKLYEVTDRDIFIRVEFEKEYYELNSEIYVKISVTNNRTESAEDGENFYFANRSGGWFRRHCTCDCACNCTGYTDLVHTTIVSDPYEGGWYSENVFLLEFPLGETFVYERIFSAEPEFFLAEGRFTFHYYLRSAEGGCFAQVEVPVEIVEMPE